jgi:hypothetical protein
MRATRPVHVTKASKEGSQGGEATRLDASCQ